MKELKDTVDGMLSSDYKERFKAEFEQTRIRHYKLSTLISKYAQGTLEFKPSCPIDLLDKQLKAMQDYLSCLMKRAKIENIEGCDHFTIWPNEK